MKRARLWPLLFLALVTLLLTWPTAATLSTHLVDRQDPLLNAWIMAWEARQILVEPLRLYDANIFFPLRNTLAFSETLLSTSLLVMPLQWLTGDALLAYNVAFLLAFASTALGGYLLALHLTGRRGAALVAAVAVAWSPYRLGHLSQLQLLFFGWLPLALLYLDRMLRGERGETEKQKAKGQRQKAKGTAKDIAATEASTLTSPVPPPTPPIPPPTSHLPHLVSRDALLFGLFFLLQALASFYSALFSAVACVVYGGGWLLWRRRLPRQAVTGGLGAAALVVAAVVPLSLPYFQVQRSLGAGWTLEQNEQFSASLQAYGYAPEQTRIWGPLTRPLRYIYGACCPPDTLFPGLTLVALAGVALVFRPIPATGPSRGRVGLWLLLLGVAFVLSLGPTLTVRAGEPTGTGLPYRWLWEGVPGFQAIRAPVRWAALGSLALSMLAAMGLARLRWRWAAPLALALVLAEFAVVPLRLVRAPEPPASLAWLRAQPPTRILELPLVAERPSEVEGSEASDPRRAWERSRLLEAQFFSTDHWHATPDGYSGYLPARHGDFVREMQGFPSGRSVALLQGLGVEYVVVHEDDLDAARAARLVGPLPVGVRDVARFGDERILALEPPSHPDLPQASLPVSALPPSQRVDVPLVLASPGGPYVPLVGEPWTIEAVWARGPESHRQTVPVPWPMIVEEIAVLRLPLDTPPPGEWTLVVSGTYPEGRGFTVEQPILVAPDAQLPALLAIRRAPDQPPPDGRTLPLQWIAREPPRRDLSLSVRLLDAAGTVVARRDGPPDPTRPTSGWLPGLTYGTRWDFPELPEGASVTDYVMQVIWYDPTDGQILSTWTGAEWK